MLTKIYETPQLFLQVIFVCSFSTVKTKYELVYWVENDLYSPAHRIAPQSAHDQNKVNTISG